MTVAVFAAQLACIVYTIVLIVLTAAWLHPSVVVCHLSAQHDAFGTGLDTTVRHHWPCLITGECGTHVPLANATVPPRCLPEMDGPPCLLDGSFQTEYDGRYYDEDGTFRIGPWSELLALSLRSFVRGADGRYSGNLTVSAARHECTLIGKSAYALYPCADTVPFTAELDKPVTVALNGTEASLSFDVTFSGICTYDEQTGWLTGGFFCAWAGVPVVLFVAVIAVLWCCEGRRRKKTGGAV